MWRSYSPCGDVPGHTTRVVAGWSAPGRAYRVVGVVGLVVLVGLHLQAGNIRPSPRL
jgi:hypothetical protein